MTVTKSDDEAASSGPVVNVRDILMAITVARGALDTALAPLVPFVEALHEVMAAAEAKLREFGQSMMHVQELCRHWDKHAPATLKGAISSQGLIVPISQMSFPDLVALLGVHREKGDDAVVQWIRGQYDEIFCAAGFLDNLEATWAANSHLNRRLPLLQQSLKAHKLRMFAVSVPTLLAQFEGLVADATNHSGLMNGETMRRHVATLANGAHVTGGMLLSFVNDALLTQFGHGSLLPPFSRHAILHGGDVDYATEVNSRTAIFLIDNLRELTEP